MTKPRNVITALMLSGLLPCLSTCHRSDAHQLFPAPSNAITATAAVVTLPQAAVIAIPEQAFPRATQVVVWSTADPGTAEEFDTSARMFGTVLRAAHEIRVNTGNVKPVKPFTVTASLPAELAARLHANDEPKIFVQVHQDGGAEVLDHFELVPSTYDPVAKTLRFDLDPDMMTDSRTADDTWEAIFLVGSTRIGPSAPAGQKSDRSSATRE